MSLLDQLWDDTVAGPRPDTGLGKLRKMHTFSGFGSNPSKEPVAPSTKDDTGMKVTRSIMIVKPPSPSPNETPPASPAGSPSPVSPFAGGKSESFRFRRKSALEAYEKASGIGSRSPRPPYDL